MFRLGKLVTVAPLKCLLTKCLRIIMCHVAAQLWFLVWLLVYFSLRLWENVVYKYLNFFVLSVGTTTTLAQAHCYKETTGSSLF